MTKTSSAKYETIPEGDPIASPAREGVDFQPVTGTVQFAPGETEKFIELQLLDNISLDPLRKVIIRLRDPVDAVITSLRFIVQIFDNERPPSARMINAILDHGNLLFNTSTQSPALIVVQGVENLNMPWENIALVNGTNNLVSVPVDRDAPAHFYRLLSGAGLGNISLNLNYGTGPAPEVQLGKAGPTLVPEKAGRYSYEGFPTGQFNLRLRRKGPLSITGKPPLVVGYYLDIPASIEPSARTLMDIKFAYEAELQVTNSCECVPWAAVGGGLINGVLTVSAAGGANGFCLESAQVVITGPNGTRMEFPIAPLPVRKAHVFSPAANGPWTVTTTVCGRTKIETITLP